MSVEIRLRSSAAPYRASLSWSASSWPSTSPGAVTGSAPRAAVMRVTSKVSEALLYVGRGTGRAPARDYGSPGWSLSRRRSTLFTRPMYSPSQLGQKDGAGEGAGNDINARLGAALSRTSRGVELSEAEILTISSAVSELKELMFGYGPSSLIAEQARQYHQQGFENESQPQGCLAGQQAPRPAPSSAPGADAGALRERGEVPPSVAAARLSSG